MPRPTAPPTPSSTDLKSRDASSGSLTALQMAFELPPPAVLPEPTTSIPKPTTSASSSFATTSQQTSSSSTSNPSETVKSRKRPSAGAGTGRSEEFALPPPPTRSRKIIQMKPREQTASNSGVGSSGGGTTPGKAAKGGGATPTTAGGNNGNGNVKKKQPSATSAAGRKIARKTAHSLIERRRRSKMNEEFAVLKGLIPACRGEMHKLAILQASIEYVRYLEDCIKQLKEQQQQHGGQRLLSPAGAEPYKPDTEFVFSGRGSGSGSGDISPDVEMTSSSLEPSPSITPNASRFQLPSMSPALLPEHDSTASASVSRHHSFSTSATTSPAFEPQVYSYPQSASGSALTSPALPPQRDLDQEATAALLMLNQTDRRGTTVVRGMSVRDLLSA